MVYRSHRGELFVPHESFSDINFIKILLESCEYIKYFRLAEDWELINFLKSQTLGYAHREIALELIKTNYVKIYFRGKNDPLKTNEEFLVAYYLNAMPKNGNIYWFRKA